MAYSVPLFSQMNTEGVDLYSAYTAVTGTPEFPGGPLAAGTVVDGTLNGEWVLCTAATATISKYDVVYINQNFTAAQTTALPGLGYPAGIAMATATTGQYFWVMTNGVSPGVNAATASANVLLYTSATPGQIAATAPAGVTRLPGIVLTTACATAGTNQGAILVALQTFTSV